MAATQTVSTSFTIAHQDAVSQTQFPINPGDPRAIQHYSTAPSLTPSTVSITTPAKAGASPGDLFQAPYQGKGSPGPMISEQNGSLVWFHPVPKDDSATNFQVQQYEGKSVLTWWQGRILEVGFGQGEDVIYNTSYQHVATIYAGNGYHADLHVIKITPQGTAWIDVFDPIHMNLSSAGGESNGVLTDSVVEEIDIKTGLVMWEWHALGHISLSESNNPAPKASYPWDYVHINSISPGPESGSGAGADQPGQVLLSSRNTWTLYDVDMHTGSIDWRLGGSHSSFKQGAGTRFYWQHDSEWQPGGLISVFDNGSDPPKEKQSRGLLLDPNTSSRTVTLAKQFTNPIENTARLQPGQPAEPRERRKHLRQLADGLRRAAELHRVRPLRSRAARRHARQERAELPHLPRPLERPGAGRAGGRGQRLLGRGQLERGHERRLLAGARWRLRDGARAGREGREGGLPDDDLGTCRQRLRRRAGARLQRRGARDLGHSQGLVRARPCPLAGVVV